MQIFIAVVLVVVAYALGTFPSAAIVAGKQNLDITKVGFLARYGKGGYRSWARVDCH